MKSSPLAATGRRLRLLGLVALVSLAGCAGGQPFDYTPVDEIPPGPGLFTGADGAFVITVGGTDEAESPEDVQSPDGD